MATKAEPIALADKDRDVLEAWLRAPSTPQSVATRRDHRWRQMASPIAGLYQLDQPADCEWRRRFEKAGPAGADQAGTWTYLPGQDQTDRRNVARAERWPRKGSVPPRDAHGPPHLVKTFKRPHFVDKLTDVVGLYMNPPDRAVVLCVDEKSIQALDRQPKKGRAGTMTHDSSATYDEPFRRPACWTEPSSVSVCRVIGIKSS